jgi:type IV secretion system protein VirD4
MKNLLADLPRGLPTQKDTDMTAPKAQWYAPETIAGASKGHYAPHKVFLGAVGDVLVGVEDDRHMLTIAGSRAGKGRSCIIPNLLHYSGSVLVIDPKGENADITAIRRHEIGQDVHVLDPFRRCAPHCAPFQASFNPLDLLKPDSKTLIDDAALIADALVIPSGGDSHWDDSAKSLVEGILLHVVTAPQYRGRRNLISVYDALMTGETVDQLEAMEGLEAAMLMNYEADGAVITAAISTFSKPEKERESVISVARKHLTFLRSKQMQTVLRGSDFELTDLQKHGTSVYLCLPAGRLSANRRWLRLFINLALEAFEREMKRPGQPPILMIMDEFPILGHMQQIEDAAGQVAGFGVKLWPIIQDLSQLKALYKDRWETFMGNSGVIQCFGNNEQTTTEWISKRLGKTSFEVVKKSDLTVRQVADGASGESRSIEVHDLLTPEEVARFFSRETGRQIIIRGGRHAMALERVNYDENPFFSQHVLGS